MEETINHFLLIWNLLMQIGIIGGIISWLKYQRATRNAIKCMLRAHIIQTCCRALERRWIAMHDYESLTEMFVEYTALNGNGTVKPLYDQTIRLRHQPPTKEGV